MLIFVTWAELFLVDGDARSSTVNGACFVDVVFVSLR